MNAPSCLPACLRVRHLRCRGASGVAQTIRTSLDVSGDVSVSAITRAARHVSETVSAHLPRRLPALPACFACLALPGAVHRQVGTCSEACPPAGHVMPTVVPRYLPAHYLLFIKKTSRKVVVHCITALLQLTTWGLPTYIGNLCARRDAG